MRLNSSDVQPLFQDPRGGELHPSGDNRSSLLTMETSQFRRNKMEEPKAGRRRSLGEIRCSKEYTGLARGELISKPDFITALLWGLCPHLYNVEVGQNSNENNQMFSS